MLYSEFNNSAGENLTVTLSKLEPVVGEVVVSTRGEHEGTEFRVKRLTATRVYIEPTGSGVGKNWGKQKSKAVGEYPIPRDLFDAGFARKIDLDGPVVIGAARYRKISTEPKPTPKPIPYTAPAKAVEGLNLSVEWITPDLASSWLARGGRNRKISDRRVTALMSAYRRGEWQLNGESVILDKEGCVVNGQHRLTACVRSGITIQSVVVRGVEPKAFDSMDLTKARAPHDVLGMHGYSSTTGTAACVRNLMFMEKFGTVNPGTSAQIGLVTPTSVLEYLEGHPDAVEGFKMGDSVRQNGLQGGSGLWGALFTLFMRSDPARVDEFQAQLSHGAGLQSGDPALLLRNRALNRNLAFSKSGAGREELAAMAIKAWNAFRAGRKLEYLAYRTGGKRPEEFPKIA